MSSIYNYIKSILNSSKIRTNVLDFSSFQLLSKLPLDPYYNFYKFIPTLHKTDEKPENGKYFNHTIGCADDLVYYASKECYENGAEFKALGINERIKSSIMQAASNIIISKAKYIIISSVGIGQKYGNPNIAVFVNEHETADPLLRIEYQIENYFTEDSKKEC